MAKEQLQEEVRRLNVTSDGSLPPPPPVAPPPPVLPPPHATAAVANIDTTADRPTTLPLPPLPPVPPPIPIRIGGLFQFRILSCRQNTQDIGILDIQEQKKVYG